MKITSTEIRALFTGQKGNDVTLHPAIKTIIYVGVLAFFFNELINGKWNF